MSVRVDNDRVRLEGDCPVEVAEVVLRLLLENPLASIDVTDCGRLHMAVVQVLLAAERPVYGEPKNPFVRDWLVPQLVSKVA